MSALYGVYELLCCWLKWLDELEVSENIRGLLALMYCSLQVCSVLVVAQNLGAISPIASHTGMTLRSYEPGEPGSSRKTPYSHHQYLPRYLGRYGVPVRCQW